MENKPSESSLAELSPAPRQTPESLSMGHLWWQLGLLSPSMCFISFLSCKYSWGQKSPKARSTKYCAMFCVNAMQIHNAGGKAASPNPKFVCLMGTWESDEFWGQHTVVGCSACPQSLITTLRVLTWRRKDLCISTSMPSRDKPSPLRKKKIKPTEQLQKPPQKHSKTTMCSAGP